MRFGFAPKVLRAVKAEPVIAPPPPPTAWTDSSGISWRYFTDHQALAAQGEYLEARYHGVAAQSFRPLPRFEEDDGVYIEETKKALMKLLTPLETYLLSGRCFH
ncbi:hypothetical protein [Caulobacter sp.]|uniref:hypothetical protein n=1 Tax=Caulobacter sp. TaxID=78 RepID=UPI0031E0B6AC